MSQLSLASLLGGIGLFLLGMRLITNGLTLAAGQALHGILERWTRTQLRGVLLGGLITSLVQSSSAVTVATLGFVNAGLIKLHQAIAIIYGSNIGTTMTAWLVAMIGFNVNIKAFALPAIGLGMFIQLLGNHRRAAAYGETLTGFGLFFLGIEVLKTGFADTAEGLNLAAMAPEFGLAFMVLAGALLTLVMQSSSAAMATIITAAGSAAVPLESAAAMVIGANIGTTSTALMAVIGATANAKRAASAHIGFNLITGLVALTGLPLLLQLTLSLDSGLASATGTATALALFHTSFNIIGVALMWPWTGRLTAFLAERFKTAEEDESRPRYLDYTLLSTPGLAIQALAMELTRIGDLSRQLARWALNSRDRSMEQPSFSARTVENLVVITGEYCAKVQQKDLPPDLAEALPNCMRISRYYTAVAHLSEQLTQQQRGFQDPLPPLLDKECLLFKTTVGELIDNATLSRDDYSADRCAEQLLNLEHDYQKLKVHILQAGTRGEVVPRNMVTTLELMSNIRRMAQQTEKGARYLSQFKAYAPAKAVEEPSTDS